MYVDLCILLCTISLPLQWSLLILEDCVIRGDVAMKLCRFRKHAQEFTCLGGFASHLLRFPMTAVS